MLNLLTFSSLLTLQWNSVKVEVKYPSIYPHLIQNQSQCTLSYKVSRCISHLSWSFTVYRNGLYGLQHPTYTNAVAFILISHTSGLVYSLLGVFLLASGPVCCNSVFWSGFTYLSLLGSLGQSPGSAVIQFPWSPERLRALLRAAGQCWGLILWPSDP